MRASVGGPITCPRVEPGGTGTLTVSAFIDQTTTNTATAKADATTICPEVTAQASATVTILPPPPCTVTQTFYAIEDGKYKVNLTNTGNKVVTLDQLVLTWPADATYTSIKEVKLDGSTYKADSSPLNVVSGIPIMTGDWTNSDVTKRQLDPGETRTLEIDFSTKWPKANCPNGTCFSGTASFAEACSVDLSQ
jgi:hypothetical protein